MTSNFERPVFAVTVDTEEEWDWNGPFPRAPFSTQNIRRIPQFQSFCQSLGVSPTYFVDHAVLEEAENRDVLNHFFSSGECDIGAHLHPWCNPPSAESNSPHDSHAVNLDIALFAAKMECLTNRLTQCTGAHPVSFRSGRWGINGAMLSVLAQLGYRLDSSVRPFYHDDGFSYHDAPTQPYRPSFDNCLDEDSSQTELVEVPVSSGFNHVPFERLNRVHRALSTAPWRHMKLIGLMWRTGLMRKITLTPEGHDAKDLCRCIDMCIARGDKVINLFFHSSDLLPGCTPYVTTEADQVRFHDRLARCIDHARDRHGVDFVTMRDLASRLNAV